MISIKQILTIKGDKDIGYRKYIIKNENDGDELNEYVISNYLKVNAGTYTPEAKDKLYFLPNCTVPRFKIKKFCEENNVAVVKFIDKATRIFYGPNTIRQLLMHPAYYIKVSRVDFNRFLPVLSDEITLFLKSNNEEELFLRYDFGCHIARSLNVGNRHDYLDINNYDCYVEIDENSFDTLSKIINKTYLHQDSILTLINSGNVMLVDQYHSIKRLLKSTDQDQKLAIELIANCDYEKSCVYLLLLFCEFGTEIYENKASGQVNFKSLLNFFNIKPRDLCYFNITSLFQSLKEHKFLNQSNLDILKDYVESSIVIGHLSPYYRVDSLRTTELLESCIAENILDQTCDTTIVYGDQDTIIPNYKLNTINE